jgi:hypothetical protein
VSSATTAAWRARAERERQEKAWRLRREAMRRLRRFEGGALPRRIGDAPSAAAGGVILDAERYAAPLAERLGPRERVQVVLWGSMLLVGLFAIVSFFSAPLMDLGLATAALLVVTMLVLSYVV